MKLSSQFTDIIHSIGVILSAIMFVFADILLTNLANNITFLCATTSIIVIAHTLQN